MMLTSSLKELESDGIIIQSSFIKKYRYISISKSPIVY